MTGPEDWEWLTGQAVPPPVRLDPTPEECDRLYAMVDEYRRRRRWHRMRERTEWLRAWLGRWSR